METMETSEQGQEPGPEQAAYERLLEELHAAGWHIAATAVADDGLELTFRPYPDDEGAPGGPALVGRGPDKAAAIRDVLRRLARRPPGGPYAPPA